MIGTNVLTAEGPERTLVASCWWLWFWSSNLHSCKNQISVVDKLLTSLYLTTASHLQKDLEGQQSPCKLETSSLSLSSVFKAPPTEPEIKWHQPEPQLGILKFPGGRHLAKHRWEPLFLLPLLSLKISACSWKSPGTPWCLHCLEFMIILLQFPKCRDHRHTPPLLTWGTLFDVIEMEMKSGTTC